MEQITEFIRPELLVLVPVLNFIGLGIKHSEKITNNLIPLLLGLFGVALAMLWVLGGMEFTGWRTALTAAFTAIVQGVLCAGCAVYVNQLWKQAKGNESPNE